MEHREALLSGLRAFGPDAGRAAGLFEEYHGLLLERNRRMNLVSRGDEGHVIPRHFLPSMGILLCMDFPSGVRILDLGSGAGFPGLPMKIVRPDLRMTLLDSKRKRAAFLKEAVRTLSLEGIGVVQARAEDVSWSPSSFDFVVSRAVTDVFTLSKWSRTCLAGPHGTLVTIKGADADKEILMLEARQEELGVRAVEKVPYNPFPDIAPLNRSVLVVVRW